MEFSGVSGMLIMSLSYEEFSSQAREFQEIAESLDDGWRLKGASDGKHYLYKTQYYTPPQVLNPCNADCSREQSVGATDSQVRESHEDGQQTFVWEYNIVYSVSYEVPALYFNVFKLGCAAPLSLDEVWDFCRLFGAPFGMNAEDLWSTVTQQEHPSTGVPNFALHPCNTQRMMQHLLNSLHFEKKNYLITWLSSVGPIVGIRMANAYCPAL
ncbi:ubiquitin-like-conjugating enzyme ATG10 [Galendromus occidentalis]|uniref:Ubiquitin-like-conjugating enzyme ATG10 n=1 Tax=Galendromus occidentalis TaxID=34638 RepID=A0AAJ7P8X6_9ACAR|nr:ubiquitin-like-conjugating enzyme ATG10 [Galendromus occidentalis]